MNYLWKFDEFNCLQLLEEDIENNVKQFIIFIIINITDYNDNNNYNEITMIRIRFILMTLTRDLIREAQRFVANNSESTENYVSPSLVPLRTFTMRILWKN